MNKTRVDYHTHDGFYRGSGEIWTIKQGWQVAKNQKISILGISPKLESKEQEFISYLKSEKEQFKDLKNPDILLGVEVDCRDPSGSLFLKQENLKFLDYIMVGPHNLPTHSLSISDLDESDYQEYFDELRTILMNSLSKNLVHIWVHPFLQEVDLYAGRFWKFLEPIYLEVLDLCQKKNIALEINANYFRTKKPTQEYAFYWKSAEGYYSDKISILKTMFTTAKQEYDVKFSFGSDSHHLEKVGDIEECIQFADSIGILDNRILILK